MPFSSTFVLLQQEAYLARGSLSTGLTSLRKAIFPEKELFYTGFFNTTIALERIMKLIVVIDHMLQHGGRPPSKKELKAYGHDLVALYASCVKAAKRLDLSDVDAPKPGSIEERILKFLSEFALSSRYYNLDALLATPGAYAEPLGAWQTIIDLVLEHDVPQTKLQQRLTQAHVIHDLIAKNMRAIQHGMDGRLLTSTEVFTVPAIHELVMPYVMVRIFRLLRPLLKTADRIGRLGFYGPPRRTSPLAPLLHEFFVHFSGDDASIRRKRKWP